MTELSVQLNVTKYGVYTYRSLGRWVAILGLSIDDGEEDIIVEQGTLY